MKSRSIFFWGTLLIMIGIPQFIEMLITSDYQKLNVMSEASLFILAFNLIYFISRFIINKFINNKNFYFKELKLSDSGNYYTFLLILFSTFIMISYIVIYYFGGFSNASWGRFYILTSSLGLLHPFRLNLYFYFAFAGLSLHYLLKKKYILVWITMLLIIVTTIVTGNRIQIIPLFVVIGLYIMFNSKRYNLKKILKILSLTIVGVYCVYLLRIIRIQGTLENFILNFNLKEYNSYILDQITSDDGELGLRNAFYYFIYNNNNFEGFNEGASYIRILLFWLPTSLSGGIKPGDFAITMGSAYLGDINNSTYSMHPTFYGDLYANFSWLGIILGVLWAIIFSCVDKILNNFIYISNLLISTIVCTSFVIFARGSLYNGFFIMIFSSFICIFFITVLNYTKKFLKKSISNF